MINRGDLYKAILLILKDHPMHGYELIREIEIRTNDVWKPSPGSLYPALKKLSEKGFINIDIDINSRKIAAITALGIEYLNTNHITNLVFENYNNKERAEIKGYLNSIRSLSKDIYLNNNNLEIDKLKEILINTIKQIEGSKF